MPGAKPGAARPVAAVTAPNRLSVLAPPSWVNAPPAYRVEESPLSASERTEPPTALPFQTSAPVESTLPRKLATEPLIVLKSPPTYTPSGPTASARTGLFVVGAHEVTLPPESTWARSARGCPPTLEKSPPR